MTEPRTSTRYTKFPAIRALIMRVAPKANLRSEFGTPALEDLRLPTKPMGPNESAGLYVWFEGDSVFLIERPRMASLEHPEGVDETTNSNYVAKETTMEGPSLAQDAIDKGFKASRIICDDPSGQQFVISIVVLTPQEFDELDVLPHQQRVVANKPVALTVQIHPHSTTAQREALEQKLPQGSKFIVGNAIGESEFDAVTGRPESHHGVSRHTPTRRP